MAASADRTAGRIAAAGLVVGAVFGLAGTLVTSDRLRACLWAIDAVGIVIGATLLALAFLRRGAEIVAGGYLVFAIGEAVILSGTDAGPPASVASFAAGTALWAAGLALVSGPTGLPTAVRVLGGVAAVLFAVTSARLFGGAPVGPLASPLPFFAYPFLVATLLGWGWIAARKEP